MVAVGKRVGAALLAGGIVLLATPAVGVESPSPAPDDRTTTLTVSPSSPAAREVLTLRGFSDCAILDGHLLFTRYDGGADNVVVRSAPGAAYDDKREKFPYAIRITVPLRARPGAARVYAEPFCGPPEEYPASPTLPLRIDRGQLLTSASPRRALAGQRIRVRAATCDGARPSLTLRVTVGRQVQDVRAPVSADGAAAASLRLGGAVGPATVTLPRESTECPGSTPAPTYRFRVLAVPGSSPEASPISTPSPSPSASASSAPPASNATPAPSASVVRARPAADRDDGGSGAAVPALIVTAAAAAATAAFVAARRRR